MITLSCLTPRDGRTAAVYPRDYEDSVSTVEYDSFKEYLDKVRQHFEELSILPLSSTEVVAAASSVLSNRDTERIQQLYREHGLVFVRLSQRRMCRQGHRNCGW